MGNIAQCPLCYNTVHVENNGIQCKCSFCGTYKVQQDVELDKISDDLRLKIRYVVKRHNLSNKDNTIILSNEKVTDIDESYNIPKLLDKIDLVMEYLEDKTEFISKKIEIDVNTLFPLFFCKNNYELWQIMQYLKEEEYILLFSSTTPITTQQIKYNGFVDNTYKYYRYNYYSNVNHLQYDYFLIENYENITVKLTTKGLKYLSDKKKNNLNSKQGFVAMWFNPKEKADTKTFRPDMQTIYAEHIKKGIENAGYEAFKIDCKEYCNDINDEMIAEIRKSRFMVADLTGYRGGVYWEAGFAEGLGIPVIYTCHEQWLNSNKDLKIEGVHFDLNHRNMILWNEDNLDEFKQKLINRIGAIIV